MTVTVAVTAIVTVNVVVVADDLNVVTSTFVIRFTVRLLLLLLFTFTSTFTYTFCGQYRTVFFPFNYTKTFNTTHLIIFMFITLSSNIETLKFFVSKS